VATGYSSPNVTCPASCKVLRHVHLSELLRTEKALVAVSTLTYCSVVMKSLLTVLGCLVGLSGMLSCGGENPGKFEPSDAENRADSGDTAPEVDSNSPHPPLPLDIDMCGSTCGPGPLHVMDKISFVFANEENVSEGFDLDGIDKDCSVVDLTAPDGTPGIDNRLGSVFSLFPDFIGTLLPEVVQSAVNYGQMTLLFEVVGVDSFWESGPAALVGRLGAGPVMQGTDGLLLPGQTFSLDPDPLLGFTNDVTIGNGTLTTGPMSFNIRLSYLGNNIRFQLFRARIRLEHHPIDDSTTGLIGGMIPLGDALKMISLLQGDDAELGALLAQIVPGLVDSRIDPDGECNALSLVMRVHGIPAFIFAESGPTKLRSQ
jgi:hypothetical protein